MLRDGKETPPKLRPCVSTLTRADIAQRGVYLLPQALESGAGVVGVGKIGDAHAVAQAFATT